MTEFEAAARWWIDAGLLDSDVAPSAPGALPPTLRADGGAAESPALGERLVRRVAADHRTSAAPPIILDVASPALGLTPDSASGVQEEPGAGHGVAGI
jgi:hypothetical protein